MTDTPSAAPSPDAPSPDASDTVALDRRSVPYAFYGLGLAILVFFVLWIAQGILKPLVVAVFICFLIVSLKNGITRIPVIGRRLPSALAYMLSFGVLVLIGIVIALIVRENVEAVLEKSPEYQQRLGEVAEDVVEWGDRVGFIPPDMLETAVEIVEGIQRGIFPDSIADPEEGSTGASIRRQVVSGVRAVVGSVTGAVGSLLGGMITVFLYTAFLLVERGRFSRKLTALAGRPSTRHRIDAAIDDTTRLVRKYISMKTLINLSVASISYVLMQFLGTDFAGFWALLIFAFGYVPIVGAVIAISLPSMLALVEPGGGIGKALLTAALLTGAEQSISSFIEPRVVGNALNLSPLVILIMLATWGSIWGFAGMFLSVPLTVVVMITLSQFTATRPIAILLSDNGEIAPIRRSTVAA